MVSSKMAVIIMAKKMEGVGGSAGKEEWGR